MYNVIIPISRKYTLLYNSFTNAYLTLSQDQVDILEKDECILREYHSEFYSQLIGAGYFVENNRDEVDLLRQRIKKIDNSDESYCLTINPTMNCNFRCWYCYEEHAPKSKMNHEVLERTKRFIANVSTSDTIKRFVLGFFGGEPLLNFREVVLPLMEHYNDCCKKRGINTFIGFTTNGYLINDSMIEDFRRNGVNFFQITLDGCKEDHDMTRFPQKGKGSYDRIVANIKKLVNNGFRVVLRINYTSKNIGKILEIGNDINDILSENKKNMSINLQRVWQDCSKENQSLDVEKTVEEQIEKSMDEFYKSGFATTVSTLDLVLNSCYADKKNQILINYNGDLYKCTARAFNKLNSVGFLSEKGELVLDEKKMAERCNIRFTKPICHDCRVAPLCGGSCSQKHLECLENQSCLLNYSELDKTKVVINKFYETFVRNHEFSIASSA